MADVIQIQPGHAPWRPAEDAQLVKQHRYYEIPLAGIVEQHGIRFAFSCISGGDERVNLWTYIMVDPETEAILDNATAETFDSIVSYTGPMVLALAADGPGIVASRILDTWTEDTLRQASEELSAELTALADTARGLVHT